MFLRNHGLVVLGSSVEEAFVRIYHVILACESQVRMMSAGLDNLHLISDTVLKTSMVTSYYHWNVVWNVEFVAKTFPRLLIDSIRLYDEMQLIAVKDAPSPRIRRQRNAEGEGGSFVRRQPIRSDDKKEVSSQLDNRRHGLRGLHAIVGQCSMNLSFSFTFRYLIMNCWYINSIGFDWLQGYCTGYEYKLANIKLSEQ